MTTIPSARGRRHIRFGGQQGRRVTKTKPLAPAPPDLRGAGWKFCQQSEQRVKVWAGVSANPSAKARNVNSTPARTCPGARYRRGSLRCRHSLAPTWRRSEISMASCRRGLRTMCGQQRYEGALERCPRSVCISWAYVVLWNPSRDHLISFPPPLR